MKDWRLALLAPEMTIYQALKAMDIAALQIGLVVDEAQKLLGVVTDGDVRRGLLRGLNLQNPVSVVMNTSPTVVLKSESATEIQGKLRQKKLHQLPQVDTNGCVVGLHIIDDVIGPAKQKALVILMLGGEGQRLRPLTASVPKPMLTVADKPILYWIIQEFKANGFFDFVFSVRYLGWQIRDYFKDGTEFGVTISYVEEQNPLGTAGALSLLPAQNEPLIVMNGDLLTKAPFSKLFQFHVEHKVMATMCVRETSYQIPYGVVGLNETQILNIDEKPVQTFFVNAGIYVLDPHILTLIPKNKYLDMTQLFDLLMKQNFSMLAYPLHEFWMDIGYPKDLEKAQSEILSWSHA